jgi:hypothetical protein
MINSQFSNLDFLDLLNENWKMKIVNLGIICYITICSGKKQSYLKARSDYYGLQMRTLRQRQPSRAQRQTPSRGGWRPVEAEGAQDQETFPTEFTDGLGAPSRRARQEAVMYRVS